MSTAKLHAPADLPPGLESRLARVTERLAESRLELPEPLAATVLRVALASEFVLDALLADPGALTARLGDPTPLERDSLAAALDLAGGSTRDAMRTLRRTRRVEMARLAWRDIAGWADLDTSLRDLSTLADAAIAAAVEFAAAELEPRFGRPVEGSGRPAPLLVLAMGKLGGAELNFSSDVDLVLLYPDGVELPGRDTAEVESYYRRLAQLVIKLLDEVTADGFVFRVDTRLRPFGSSGPLAVSLAAFETYLVQHARDWERYAYVKARLVTGAEFTAQVFGEILTPFVYRRYLDYGVFAALRQMKRLIREQVKRKDMHDNIKLGEGGIREVEFVAQVFQLIRGGSMPALRARSLLDVLPLLAEVSDLSGDEIEALTAAYRFLRQVENRLQALDDRQTHSLPSDAEQRARLALACAAPDWQTLADEVARHRATIASEFARVAWDAEGDGAGYAGDDALLLDTWKARALAEHLGAAEFASDAEAMQLIDDLAQSGLYRRMDEPSRKRLTAVVTRLVPLFEGRDDAGPALRRILPVLQSICRRSAYLALLYENPGALQRLVDLAGQSPMLALQMAEHPLLLDELLDPRLLERPPTREELKRALDEQVAASAEAGIEGRLDAMRAFQRAAVFRIAIADRLGGLPIMKVSDRLTDTAELVLELALDTAWAELVAKHGTPMHGNGRRVPSGFAIVAYGKLGGLELGYGSDLDLVFLHDSSGEHQETTGPAVLENQRFFVRLVQRLIHFLTLQTSSGRLYEIDTRLRPSGASGLMVSSIANFHRYQRHEAWIWEHQALLRSRSVAGSPALRAIFEAERRDVLVNHVDRERLHEEVKKMRARMRRELSQGSATAFDLKQDPGGLADIEFLVDYWILLYAAERADLVAYPDNVRQLEALAEAGLVPAERCRFLTESYLTLREHIHELALGDGRRVVAADRHRELREGVEAIWNDVFGPEPES